MDLEEAAEDEFQRFQDEFTRTSNKLDEGVKKLGEILNGLKQKFSRTSLKVKVCSLRFQLLRALASVRWKTIQDEFKKHIASFSIYRDIIAAICGNGDKLSIESFISPSFLTSISMEEEEEIDRIFRLLSFAVIYITAVADVNQVQYVANVLTSTSPSLRLIAKAFGCLDSKNRRNVNLSEAAYELSRFPLAEIFPFKVNSALESEGVFVFEYLMKKVEACNDDSNLKIDLAKVALWIHAEFIPETEEHIQLLAVACRESQLDAQSSLSILRRFYEFKPYSWMETESRIFGEKVNHQYHIYLEKKREMYRYRKQTKIAGKSNLYMINSVI